MKNLFLTALLFAMLFVQSTFARTVEIDVYGMTCPFCVDSLERKFKKMDSVSNVNVSLKLKKVRLETDANSPSLKALKKAVTEAGFTPVKIRVISK